jgi:hypothetical protein
MQKREGFRIVATATEIKRCGWPPPEEFKKMDSQEPSVLRKLVA